MNRNAFILALCLAVPGFALTQTSQAAEPAKQAKQTQKDGKAAKTAKSMAAPAGNASAADVDQWKGKPFVQRFKHADANADGKLSKGEAGAGYTPDVAEHFAAMDSNKDGFVTPQERSNFNTHMAEHKAAAKSNDKPVELVRDKISKPRKG